MSRTHTFSSRPWRHTGKFSRKKEDMVNTDEDIVNADKDMVNADKEEATKDRDSQDREETVKGVSEDIIKDIIKAVTSAVDVPIWVKLTPSTSKLVDAAKVAYNAGGASIALCNTFPSLP